MLIERYDVREVDNRDPSTTWLWLDSVDTPSYVEVNPVELFMNMVENCMADEGLMGRLRAVLHDYNMDINL